MYFPSKEKSPKKSQKRQRNEKKWERNVRKELRNSGKEYITKTRDGRLLTQNAREIGPPCKCLNRCYLKFDAEAIEYIFESFWNIGCYNQQSQYLAHLIDRTSTINQLKFGAENKSCVKFKNKYNIEYGNNRIVVCKTAFLNILGVTKDRIQHNNRKRTESGIVQPDKRGQHVKFSLPESQVKLVHEHIQMIPARSSHYTRNCNEHRQYVDTPDKKSLRFFMVNTVNGWKKIIKMEYL